MSSSAMRYPIPAAEPSTLPDSTSSDLELVSVTPEEAQECILINSAQWNGPLSQEAYLRREAHLASQTATANGALSRWILVDKNDSNSPRTILSACESFRKRAFLAKRGGGVKHATAFGVGSVYCRDEYRGKGYAMRMMAELRKKLESWQQADGKKAEFTVLYSDIGKKFYAKNGWIPYPSTHISLKPNLDPLVKDLLLMPLGKSDLPELCRKDESLIRHSIAKFPPSGPDLRVALIPSSDIMDWHHAREEFLAKELIGRIPKVKGAIVTLSNRKAVWCVWTRVFAKNQRENTLYILRFVVEDEDGTSRDPSSSESVRAVAACLAAAQQEAAIWKMNEVQLWSPSPTVQAGAKILDPEAKVIHRATESITSLNWHGNNPGTSNVEWIANEKFGWS